MKDDTSPFGVTAPAPRLTLWVPLLAALGLSAVWILALAFCALLDGTALRLMAPHLPGWASESADTAVPPTGQTTGPPGQRRRA